MLLLWFGFGTSPADSAFAWLNSKLWKRIYAEATTEINLLAENWKYILAGLIFQVSPVCLSARFDSFLSLLDIRGSSLEVSCFVGLLGSALLAPYI